MGRDRIADTTEPLRMRSEEISLIARRMSAGAPTERPKAVRVTPVTPDIPTSPSPRARRSPPSPQITAGMKVGLTGGKYRDSAETPVWDGARGKIPGRIERVDSIKRKWFAMVNWGGVINSHPVEHLSQMKDIKGTLENMNIDIAKVVSVDTNCSYDSYGIGNANTMKGVLYEVYGELLPEVRKKIPYITWICNHQTTETLRSIGDRVNRKRPWGQRKPLFIWNWTYISGIRASDHPPSQYVLPEGVKISTNDSSWRDGAAYTNMGLMRWLSKCKGKNRIGTRNFAITDNEQSILGVVWQNNILVPFDFSHTKDKVRFKLILHHLIKNYINPVSVLTEAKEMSTAGAVGVAIKGMQGMIKRKVIDLESKVRNYRNKAKAAIEYAESIERDLKSLKATGKNKRSMRKKLMSDINKMRSRGTITNVTSYGGTSITLTTADVILEKKHNIGKYEIHVDFNHHRLEVWNEFMNSSDYQHPHVNTGNMCLGNIGSDINRSMEAGQLLDLVSLITTYLTRVNKSDVYISMSSFIERLERRKKALNIK